MADMPANRTADSIHQRPRRTERNDNSLHRSSGVLARLATGALHVCSAEPELDAMRQIVDKHRDSAVTGVDDGDAPLRPCANAARAAIWE